MKHRTIWGSGRPVAACGADTTQDTSQMIEPFGSDTKERAIAAGVDCPVCLKMSNDKPEQMRTLTNEQQNLRDAFNNCDRCQQAGGRSCCPPCWDLLKAAVDAMAPPTSLPYYVGPERPETNG